MGLPNALKSGQWFSAAGDGKISHVAREDVARAAAAALSSQSTVSETYDITSDEAFTTQEIAAIAAKATGKPLQVVEVTDGQLIAGLQAHGVPAPMAAFIACFDTNTRLGGLTAPTDAVRKLTGLAPRKLEAYLTEHAAEYV